MSAPDAVRRYFSRMGKKGSKSLWKSMTPAQRSAEMKRRRALGVERARARNDDEG